MKVILFGASGMVGQGVLRQCLEAHDVEAVLTVGRHALAQIHSKLRQLVQEDLFHYDTANTALQGYDTCFFCLGVSANEVDEAGYIRLNHDLPLAAAQAVLQPNPGMCFAYISGAGTDATGRGKIMWARVKGKTENALQRLGFRAVYLLRPGVIVPLHGEQSKTRVYRLFYSWFGWALQPLARWFPTQFLDTARIGQAMLQAVRTGAPSGVLEARDIDRLAQQTQTAHIH